MGNGSQAAGVAGPAQNLRQWRKGAPEACGQRSSLSAACADEGGSNGPAEWSVFLKAKNKRHADDQHDNPENDGILRKRAPIWELTFWASTTGMDIFCRATGRSANRRLAMAPPSALPSGIMRAKASRAAAFWQIRDASGLFPGIDARAGDRRKCRQRPSHSFIANDGKEERLELLA